MWVGVTLYLCFVGSAGRILGEACRWMTRPCCCSAGGSFRWGWALRGQYLCVSPRRARLVAPTGHRVVRSRTRTLVQVHAFHCAYSHVHNLLTLALLVASRAAAVLPAGSPRMHGPRSRQSTHFPAAIPVRAHRFAAGWRLMGPRSLLRRCCRARGQVAEERHSRRHCGEDDFPRILIFLDFILALSPAIRPVASGWGTPAFRALDAS